MATKWRSSLKTCPASGPDSAESWVTAVCCGFLLLLSFSAMCVSGVFFYGIVETFGAARESASWPVTLNCSLVLLAGPVMGFLSKRYSCRKVLHACAFISGPAVCLCFFAGSIPYIAVFFGVIHGIALSGLYVGANVLVAQHFEERRTTACSVMFTIGGLSAIVFPALAEVSYATYGIRGAFLLYGATLLNAVPFVILLKSPPWLETPKPRRVIVLERSTPCTLDEEFTEEECNHDGLSNTGVDLEPRNTQNCKQDATDASTGGSPGGGHVSRAFVKKKLRINIVTGNIKHAVKPFITCVFWLDAMSFSAVTMGMVMFVSTSTDYAIDQGISSADAIFLLHAYSVSDILVRPLTGVAIDSKILTLESAMLLGFLVQAVAFEMLAWFRALHAILIASALMGATCGSRMALQAPALVKNFGMEKLPTMIGAMSWCMGVVLLLRPPIVGYFRDTLGSYTGLMHAAAACNAVFVAIWMAKLVQRRMQCWRKEGRYRTQGESTC